MHADLADTDAHSPRWRRWPNCCCRQDQPDRHRANMRHAGGRRSRTNLFLTPTRSRVGRDRRAVGPHRLHRIRRPRHTSHAAPTGRRTRSVDDEAEFEDAIAATTILPGPASTQLAIFLRLAIARSPRRARRRACSSAPDWPPSSRWPPSSSPANPPTWIKGARSAPERQCAGRRERRSRPRPGELAPRPDRSRRAVAGCVTRWREEWPRPPWGPFLVVVLVGCGLIELAPLRPAAAADEPDGSGHTASGVAAFGGLGALAWVALKVGALSSAGAS